MTPDDDDFLGDYFAEARSVRAPVSSDLMARVLIDAEPQPTWRKAIDFIGGWAALGGVVTAGVVGVWFGVAPPAVMTDVAANWIGEEVELALWSDSALNIEEWIDG